MAKQIFVNELIQNNDVIRYAIVGDKTIQKTMKKLYDDKVRNNLIALTQREPTKSDGFFIFSKFCQFVVYFQHRPPLGISIELMDFTNTPNINAAFEYLIELRSLGWDDKTRDKIQELAHEIKKNENSEQAEIVIVPTLEGL